MDRSGFLLPRCLQGGISPGTPGVCVRARVCVRHIHQTAEVVQVQLKVIESCIVSFNKAQENWKNLL